MQQAMKDMLGNFKGVETIESSYGTVYAVIAEKNGIKLTVAPKIMPTDLFGVALRLRARGEVNDNTGPMFGFPEMQRIAPNRSGTEMVVYVTRADMASAFSIGKMLQAESIPTLMVGVLYERLKQAGVKPSVEQDVFAEYINQAFMRFFPSDDDGAKNIEEFKVAVGKQAINQNYVEIKKALYPDYAANLAKQSENDDGEGDNDDTDDEEDQS